MNAVSIFDPLLASPMPCLPCLPGSGPEARRILALAFPFLPTDRITRARRGPWWRSRAHPEGASPPGVRPLACAERTGGAIRLRAVDELALSQGLHRGQGLTEARAICPSLDVVAADMDADRRFLEALADWADRYTPLVGIDGADGLFLDIAGCAHLFGGERALVTDCLGRLFHLGIEARAAVAPTPALAWALARHDSGRIAEPDEVAQLVQDLPVSALRAPPAEVAALARVGLKRIGDIMEAPRPPLARRFGFGLLARLDRITGREAEPISPRRAVAELMAERRLSEPVTGLETVEELAGQLAGNLRASLEWRGAGAREMELSLFRVDGAVKRIRVGTARPTRDPRHMRRLLAERLGMLHDEMDAGYGFETVRLCVPVFDLLDAGQADFSGRAVADRAFPELADRLSARLGPERVLMPLAHASHLPERAITLVPPASISAGGQAAAQGFLPPSGAPRPLRLFARPEPVTVLMVEVPEGPPVTFRWRRSHHRVARAEGPERIAAEWWIDGEDTPARDYYRVEDDTGRRYWLFREGLYERDPVPPRWFMHGLLA